MVENPDWDLNERDWLEASYARRLAVFVGSGAGRGKLARVVSDARQGRALRAFVAACAERLAPRLVDDRSRAALDFFQRWARGDSPDGSEIVRADAEAAARALEDWSPTDRHAAFVVARLLADEADLSLRSRCLWASFQADSIATALSARRAPDDAGGSDVFDPRVAATERRVHADFFRDAIGNPFRRRAFDPAWRTDVALRIAGGIDASGDFSGLSILADALEEAGCDDPEILAHLRSPGPHIRGCWAVRDALDDGADHANLAPRDES